MSLREIRILYLHELRSAWREPNIVLHAVLFPIVMYPALLWGVITAMTFVIGQSEATASRVALLRLPPAHAALKDMLTKPPASRKTKAIEAIETVDDLDELQLEIRTGQLDVLAVFGPPRKDGEAFGGNCSVQLYYDASKDRSATALHRVERALEEYRDKLVHDEATRLGVTASEWEQFHIGRKDVATSSESGAFFMAFLLPVPLLLMIALGCFNPAIDSTAGERERGTWETTMTLAASRNSVLIAKYLYVATVGCIAGLLNVAAMFFTCATLLRGMLEGAHVPVQFDFPLSALPVLCVGSIMLALLFAAMMMVMAAFARTFKEGQSMTMPLYLLILAPTVLLASPELRFTPSLALVPVANVMFSFREAIMGRLDFTLFGVTALVTGAALAGSLVLARFVTQFEDVLVGSYSGSVLRLLRDRLLRGGKS